MNSKGMGATGAALWLDADKAHIAHVGDGRVYVFRDGKLTQLTEDHSLLNDDIRRKDLTADEIGLPLRTDLEGRAVCAPV